MLVQYLEGKDAGQHQHRESVSERPETDGDRRGIDMRRESSHLPCSARTRHQHVEAGIGNRGILQIEASVEHHPVQGRVSKGVRHVGGSERDEITDRVTGRAHDAELFRQADEALLADGAPQPGHAVEVRVHGHRRHARTGDDGTKRDGFPAGEHLGRPLDQLTADCDGCGLWHLRIIP